MKKRGMNTGWAPALCQEQTFPLLPDPHTHTPPQPLSWLGGGTLAWEGTAAGNVPAHVLVANS